MLGGSRLVAVAATVDSVKSRAFYEGVLGLTLAHEDEYASVYDAQGVELRIQKVRALTPQPHTQLGWSVSSIDQVLQALRHRGVTFEKYSFLEQDPNGVWTSPLGGKIAWFKDPDGNLLSVTQEARG
jgi:catechol 2,3-dioxygenase-like lactoylglutathione lyase family enzyme